MFPPQHDCPVPPQETTFTVPATGDESTTPSLFLNAITGEVPTADDDIVAVTVLG